jgi:hypothetical protein
VEDEDKHVRKREKEEDGEGVVAKVVGARGIL